MAIGQTILDEVRIETIQAEKNSPRQNSGGSPNGEPATLCELHESEASCQNPTYGIDDILVGNLVCQ